jgi:hypothetical protein
MKEEVLALLLVIRIGPPVLLQHEDGVLVGHGVEEVGHEAAYHDVRVTSLATSGWAKRRNASIR